MQWKSDLDVEKFATSTFPMTCIVTDSRRDYRKFRNIKQRTSKY